MTNLEERFKDPVQHKYTIKQKTAINKSAIRILGRDKCLYTTIEEMAELINIISINTLDKFDYLHTLEETVDVYMAMHFIRDCCHITKINISDYTNRKKGLYDKINPKKRIFSYLKILSQCQQDVTKYLRGGTNSDIKLIETVIMLDIVTTDIRNFYHLKEEDFDHMLNIKYSRIDDKIRKGILF